jgi:DNA-binding NarL/FixJ family response regulator
MNLKKGGQTPLAVSIVDDDPAIRRTLSLLLAKMEGFTLAGAYESGQEALREIAAKTPDLVLMDIRLRDMSGLDCARKVLGLKPAPRLIFITGFPDADGLKSALQIGGISFLTKPFTPDQLEEALRIAAHGAIYFSPAAKEILSLSPAELEEKGRRQALRSKLTRHEQEVLQLAAEGLGCKHIAEKLRCSPHTVNNSLRFIRVKLGAHSTPEAAYLAGFAGTDLFGGSKSLNSAGGGARGSPP